MFELKNVIASRLSPKRRLASLTWFQYLIYFQKRMRPNLGVWSRIRPAHGEPQTLKEYQSIFSTSIRFWETWSRQNVTRTPPLLHFLMPSATNESEQDSRSTRALHILFFCRRGRSKKRACIQTWIGFLVFIFSFSFFISIFRPWPGSRQRWTRSPMRKVNKPSLMCSIIDPLSCLLLLVQAGFALLWVNQSSWPFI